MGRVREAYRHAPLFAGRLTYRAAMYGAGVVLVALWGPQEFAVYASATGAVGWVFALASSGPEKAALVLVPRAGGRALERTFVVWACLPWAVCCGATAVVALTSPATALAYLVAATTATAVGGAAVTVSLFRMWGEPAADYGTYVMLALTYVVTVLAAMLGGLGARAALGLLAASSSAVLVVMVAQAWRRCDQVRPPRRLRMEAVHASVVLGAGELLSMAGVSAVFAMMALAGDDRQISLFYLLMMVTSSFSVGYLYALRLWQPHLSRQLERDGAGAADRRAGRTLVVVLCLAVPALILLVAVNVTTGASDIVAVAALVIEMLCFGGVGWAVVLVETASARGRGWSAAGAVGQLLAVVSAGWWLVPAGGAGGGLTAILAGITVRAVWLEARLVASRKEHNHAVVADSDPRRASGGQPVADSSSRSDAAGAGPPRT